MPGSPQAPKILVALDYAEASAALKFADQVSPELCGLKVGKELFTSAGPELVKQLVKRNFNVFLDLKFHDIPTTVAKACIAAADLGVWMLNLHCLGGRQMMELAAQSLKDRGYHTQLIGVTILTSLNAAACQEVGLPGDLTAEVSRLAQLGQECGLAGVVCSAHEASILRKQCGNDFLLVTPGIRDANMPADDQQRTMTPQDAIAAGSSYLVIGRMITTNAYPLNKLKQLTLEVGI